MTNPDPSNGSSKRVGHETVERHDTSHLGPGNTSHKVDERKGGGALRWLLPLLALLSALLIVAFVGDNDVDNSPDMFDQIGNNQPGNCSTTNATGEDKGVGDIAPDDQNNCEE